VQRFDGREGVGHDLGRVGGPGEERDRVPRRRRPRAEPVVERENAARDLLPEVVRDVGTVEERHELEVVTRDGDEVRPAREAGEDGLPRRDPLDRVRPAEELVEEEEARRRPGRWLRSARRRAGPPRGSSSSPR
jgi:hypothetical protein